MQASRDRARQHRPLVLLSFDVEEFDIPLEYGRNLSLSEQMRVGREGFVRVLDLLDELPQRPTATLFTTAIFAEHNTDLIQRAAERHEIASHGFTHAKEMREGDLERSRNMLASISGQEIHGFRRPRFAATDPATIEAAGYSYNSSEHPTFVPGRYNNLSKPRRAYLAPGTQRLLNIPVSVSPLLRAPMSWLAFKNFPEWFVRGCAHRTLASDGCANFLWHPWEFADIDTYGLPRFVRRVQGNALTERLRRFLIFLSGRGEFRTFSQYESMLRGQAS